MDSTINPIDTYTRTRKTVVMANIELNASVKKMSSPTKYPNFAKSNKRGEYPAPTPPRRKDTTNNAAATKTARCSNMLARRLPERTAPHSHHTIHSSMKGKSTSAICSDPSPCDKTGLSGFCSMSG